MGTVLVGPAAACAAGGAACGEVDFAAVIGVAATQWRTPAAALPPLGPPGGPGWPPASVWLTL
ncbi:MAG: hypothetical protein GTO03_12385 [Planctomycetales bacterium]|nr:hypothetical protein [Planctomycetales bacterium]